MQKKKKDDNRQDDNRKSKSKTLKYAIEPLANFVHMNTWRERGVSKAFIELICGRLMEYFADKDKICLEEFLVDNQIHINTYYGWVKQHAKLAEVHSFIKMLIGARREKGMLRKELDSKSGMYTQYQYAANWKEADAYWAEIKKLEKDIQKPNVTVVMAPLGQGGSNSIESVKIEERDEQDNVDRDEE